MLQERRAGDPRRTDITGGTTTYFLLEEDETRTHIFVKRSEDGSIKSIVWERTTLDRYETKKTHTITNKDQDTLEKIARYMDM